MRQWQKLLLVSFLGLLFAQSVISVIMRFSRAVPQLFTAITYIPFTGAAKPTCEANTDVSLSWYPPAKTEVNSLSEVLYSNGTYGFIFDSSDGPINDYNYCNMPRVNPATYPMPQRGYELLYVEVIQRHHKRTPYLSNTFPKEAEVWLCDDENLYYGAMEDHKGSGNTYWQVYNSPVNPLAPRGFNGSCQFPQMTAGGLEDSHRHGDELSRLYRALDHLPPDYRPHAMTYRVTNNVITSQVAAMLIQGMWEPKTAGGEKLDTPLYIQPRFYDSLEPDYPCPYANKLFATYGPGSDSATWQEHLKQSASLKARLDSVSGVDPRNKEWRRSWDHYFDNLSSRLCHGKPLPCSTGENSSDCITRDEADMVFRLGEYEYSYIYRDSPDSLNASVASFGIWVGELAQNIRATVGQEDLSSVPETSPRVRFRHNTAHDGSIARLLSILQISKMVWPGMGAELVFEVYLKRQCYFVRVLWGGQIMRSSHPAFGHMDMIPVDTLLAYFDGLVGVRGVNIPDMCQSS